MGRLILRVVELTNDPYLVTSEDTTGSNKRLQLMNGLTLVRVFSAFIMEVTIIIIKDTIAC